MVHSIENANGTLTALMQKVQDNHAKSADFLTPTNQLQFRTKPETGDWAPESQIIMEGSGGEPTRFFDLNDVAFSQVAVDAGLDTKTARKLQRVCPEEYDGVMNKLWQSEPKKKLLRTHAYGLNEPVRYTQVGSTGVARAWVSDKFKTFDNHNLLKSILPPLMESDAQFKVVNAVVTDKRLYLRLKSEAHVGAGANVNDLMANGIGASNSETGHGSISVYQLFWTLACKNGMQTENRSRSAHITSARSQDDYGLLSSEAKAADNHALELKTRDLVKAYSSRQNFDETIQKMRDAANDIVEGSVNTAAENLGKVLQLTKLENKNVLDGLMQTIGQAGYSGQPVSRATMVNAVTAVANNPDIDCDNVDDWQKRGGQVLNMSKSDWARVAVAA
jgi:hypothetical protein